MFAFFNLSFMIGLSASQDCLGIDTGHETVFFSVIDKFQNDKLYTLARCPLLPDGAHGVCHRLLCVGRPLLDGGHDRKHIQPCCYDQEEETHRVASQIVALFAS